MPVKGKRHVKVHLYRPELRDFKMQVESHKVFKLVVAYMFKDLRGREYFTDYEYRSKRAKFLIKYRPDINTDWLILYRKRFYKITQVKPFGNKDGLEIYAAA